MDWTEYVNVPVPVEVDAGDARRGNNFDVVGVGHSASGGGNRTSDSSSARGTYRIVSVVKTQAWNLYVDLL